jgi:AbrB family looped-hinge helix DNA binding protein
MTTAFIALGPFCLLCLFLLFTDRRSGSASAHAAATNFLSSDSLRRRLYQSHSDKIGPSAEEFLKFFVQKAASGERGVGGQKKVRVCASMRVRKDSPTMTTVLSQKGQIVLPVPGRQQLHLQPGDDFEVAVEDEDTITLRRISHPANRGFAARLPVVV